MMIMIKVMKTRERGGMSARDDRREIAGHRAARRRHPSKSAAQGVENTAADASAVAMATATGRMAPPRQRLRVADPAMYPVREGRARPVEVTAT